MDAELLRRVTAMVAEFAGYPPESLSADSVLEADVGITGDDAGEFMEDYSREFRIDLSGFEFYRHFDADGWNPFAGFFTMLRGGEAMQHVPVTVGLLVRTAEEHRWPGFIVFLLTAWTAVGACAARSPESFIHPMTPQEVLASRVACDSVVGHAASMGQHVYRKSEVELAADLIHQDRGPRYPGGPQPAAPRTPPETPEIDEGATVRTVFVVDSTGQPDTTTFQSIAPVPDKFLQSVRVYLPNARYKPARLAGRTVAQCVEQPFVFVPA